MIRAKKKNFIFAAGAGGASALGVTVVARSEACLTGKRATNRDAISPAADCAQCPPVTPEIINATRFTAASLGSSFNRAASPHGSTPRTTLGRPCYALGVRPGPIQIRPLTRSACVLRHFVYGGTFMSAGTVKWFNSQKGNTLFNLMTARKTCSYTSRPSSGRGSAICRRAKSCATRSSAASKARPRRSIFSLPNKERGGFGRPVSLGAMIGNWIKHA